MLLRPHSSCRILEQLCAQNGGHKAFPPSRTTLFALLTGAQQLSSTSVQSRCYSDAPDACRSVLQWVA